MLKVQALIRAMPGASLMAR